MKNRILLVFSFLGLMAIGSSFSLMQQPLRSFQKSNSYMGNNTDNKDKWKQVDSLIAIGLPQSALDVVNDLYIMAQKEGNMPEFLKAGIYQLRLRSDFEEDYILKYIGETEKNIETTPAPARQVLHSMLADLYWQYYQQNRYRILDQTVVSGEISDDVATWDAKKLVDKVASNYLESLDDAKLLQSVSLKMYDPILQVAEGSKKFRPTLFDFLAHRAIDFFMNEEASITKPINPFVMKDLSLLSKPDEFARLKITTPDSLSFHFNALNLLAQLEKFHLSDKEPDALVDATLKRLEFVHDKINQPDKDSVYLSTLLALEARFKENPVSADVIEKIANYWYSGTQKPEPLKSQVNNSSKATSNYVTAHEWCLKAINKFPESDGAKNCRVMLQSIEEPSLMFNIDQEAVPGEAFPVLISFRNTGKVWFRLLAPDYDKEVNLRQNIFGERGLDKYLAMNPVKSWSIELPETSDYQTHSTEAIMPALQAGYYTLLISGNEKFDRGSSPVAIREFWVSAISYISKRDENGTGLFYLLNRGNGHLLQGVKVQSFSREYDYRTRSYIRKDNESYLTGSDGSFEIKSLTGSDYSSLSFDFRLNNDRLVAENYFSRYRNSPPDMSEKIRTFFFTDRAIYRPGQPVYFKGIVIGTENEKSRVVTDNRSTVTLYDVNGQKVSVVDVVTNKYGSFSGSFVLPASGLGGQFRIENGTGTSYFNVEEYKRPKFEVTFQPVTGSYRLSEKITVNGQAESYSGISISDAKVSYRVVRSASFPFLRYGWRIWPGMMPESEIANGTITTNADGDFDIEFKALPDPSDYGDLNPVYAYTVYADVTDINGETRSATTTVQVSSKALIIGLDIPVSLNRDVDKRFKLSTTNLNGKRTPAIVTIEVFRLKDEDRLTRPRRWPTPDLAMVSRDEFISQLPSDIFMDDDNHAAKKEKSVFKEIYNTATDSLISISGIAKWEPGRYLVSLVSVDAYGQNVSTDKEIVVFATDSKKVPVKQALWVSMLTTEAKAGEKISLLAGSAAKNARLLFEVQMKGKTIRKEWLNISQEQKLIEIPVPESYIGNVAISLTLVSDNRSYGFNTSLEVPDTRYQLNIAFETFRSPLLPGGTEKWKLKLTSPDGKPMSAELLAGMYDASLDAFTPHNWYFEVFKKWYEFYQWESNRAFQTALSYATSQNGNDRFLGVSRQYDQLNWFGYYIYGNRYMGRELHKGGLLRSEAMAVPEASMEMDGLADMPAEKVTMNDETAVTKKEPEPQIRRNLNETAFFYPQLTTNEQGEVQVEFTVPEALTRWNFMGLAHTADLRYGQFSKEVVTRKELMVAPNLPRFFREGDRIEIQTKVSNLTANPMQGEARLQLFDAITLKPVDELMKNQMAKKAFSLDASGNTSVGWEIVIPEGIDAVMVRISAQAGNHSDGEEAMLPVLTNRMMVTETLPLPINGNESRDFTFDKLISQENGSKSLRNHRLTLEFTSNPAWYAVQALPYLAEQTNENSDQVFNRLYANSLASYIANSSPKIRNVFETWKNLIPDALLSNLEKNQDLKALLLEETPWLMEAKNESAQKQRLALMFDLNRMATEQQAAKRKLQQSQSSNGGWPWFEGMPESRYITQLIVTGFGRMHYLKVTDLNNDDASPNMVQQAVNYLSSRVAEDYKRLLKDYPTEMDKNHLSQDHIQFLFAMSYLKGVVEPSGNAAKAIAYFSGQARKYWTGQGLYTQGMIALWAGRNGDKKTSDAIMKSLRERSLSNPEMGMYWRDNRSGYFWYESPIETQALLIELFEEMGNDQKSVDQMKTWLLKQKQTQSWPTSRATADAVYALLLRGGNWLQTDPGVIVKLGRHTIDPSITEMDKEAGSGYFKIAWNGSEIEPAMGNVEVSKTTEGPAWGAIYWQYFENLDKVTTHDSPLKISKLLFIKTNTASGPVLEPITGDNKLIVGQQITVRIELRTDRNLEYVHLKDMRASAFEPVNTLSGYRWNGGLGYYENTRDAATNFFFGYLPKGTWVFEYPLVVSQKGEFSNGVTSVQCMYAPEFAAHSEGIRVIIK